MSQAGVVTVVAKVLDKDRAKADIRDLAAEQQRAAREATAAAQAQAQAQREAQAMARARIAAERALADAQRETAAQTARIADQIQDRMNRATMSGVDYRIHQVRREAEQIDATIRRMVISRKEKEDLIFKNVAAMEAQITRVTQEEAEKQARAHREAQQKTVASMITPSADAPAAGARTSVGFAEIAAMAGRATAAIGTVSIALYAFGNAATFARDQAALYESSMKTLQIVSDRTGGNFAANKKLVNEFSDAISSPAAAAQAVRVFQTMNIPLAEQRKLIASIRDGIVAMGGDVNEQLPVMALAVKRGEGELLDNMGVVSTVESMYKRFAATIDTTVDKLNEQQKTQAIINGILKELATFTGVAQQSTETYKGSVNNLNAALRDLATEQGERLNPHLVFMNNQIANLIRGFKELGTVAKNPKIPDTPKAGELGLPADFKPSYTLPGGVQGLRSKQEQEQFEQGQRKAQQDATEKAEKERKQAAERASADQKNLAKELEKDLATIGKEGRDLEMAQLKLWYDEKSAMAHGDASLLEKLKRDHNLRMQQIDAKYPPNILSGTNTSALSISMGGGIKGLDLSKVGTGGWSASGGQAQPSASLTDPGEEWYASIKQATDNGLMDGVKSAASADFGGLGQSLLSIMSKAPDPMIQALVGPAGLAITFGQMIANSFTQAAERADQVSRHIRDLDAGTNPLSKSELRDREVKDDSIRNGLVGEEASLRQQAFERSMTRGVPKAEIEYLNRQADARHAEIEAIDRARKASWDSADAAEVLADKHRALSDAAEQATARIKDGWKLSGDAQGRAKQAFQDYQVTTGQATRRDLGISQAGNDLTTGLSTLNRVLAASGGKAITLDDLKNHPDGAGLLSGVNSAGLQAGSMQNFGEANAVLYDTLEAFFRKLGLEADNNRVGPGATPDRPIYSSIVNFKDMYAFEAPGERFRASGPGTSRADGMKGRAVNTRAV